MSVRGCRSPGPAKSTTVWPPIGAWSGRPTSRSPSSCCSSGSRPKSAPPFSCVTSSTSGTLRSRRPSGGPSPPVGSWCNRAQARLRGAKPRGVSARDKHRGLLDRLLAAIEAGDQDRLLALLAPDATLISDGGGKVATARNVIRGADRVARLLLGLARKRTLRHDITSINGDPGVVRRRAGKVHSTLSIAADAGQIRAVYIVLNPDKLRSIGAVRQGTAAQ
jgi:hypothetical protein